MDSHYQRHLEWLITMARHPGFKAHAWHRAKELDADPSKLFAGIKDALVAAIGLERGSESGSLDQQSDRSVGTK